jgi:hypothetical protein
MPTILLSLIQERTRITSLPELFHQHEAQSRKHEDPPTKPLSPKNLRPQSDYQNHNCARLRDEQNELWKKKIGAKGVMAETQNREVGCTRRVCNSR